MTTKFTSGPWFVDGQPDASDYSHPTRVMQRGGSQVASAYGWGVLSVSLANAHLIAAAPDLYEALRGMLDQPETSDAYDAMSARAQAALAKAEGKS